MTQCLADNCYCGSKPNFSAPNPMLPHSMVPLWIAMVTLKQRSISSLSQGRPKSEKLFPRPQNNTKHRAQSHRKSNFCGKCFLQYVQYEILANSPKHPNFDSKVGAKSGLETSPKQTERNSTTRSPSNFQNGAQNSSPNLTKI